MAAVAIMGLIGGLWLLARGVGGYRTAGRIADTSTSTISALAVGEVRVSGVIEAAELTLVSLLQATPCVYFRSSVELGDDRVGRDDLVEERSVGIRVRDDSGSVRVFPRGARIDAPERFHDQDSPMGDVPTALDWRVGARSRPRPRSRGGHRGPPARRRPPERLARPAPSPRVAASEPTASVVSSPATRSPSWGTPLPFGEMADPTSADIGGDAAGLMADDPEIAADLARARADGTLLDDPEDAWGNAAIPGFGIGRPVREPDLDPAADVLPVATAEEAERVERTFTIGPGTLVLARTDDAPLLVTYGTPAAAADRHASQFLIGLLGAVVAIAAAVVLALQLDGGLAA